MKQKVVGLLLKSHKLINAAKPIKALYPYILVGFLQLGFLLFPAVSRAQDNRVWSTYYGSTGDENILAVTSLAGNVYVGGYTNSVSNIASGGFQNIYGGGGSDAFFVKFDMAGNPVWSSYYGGSGDESIMAMATDASGNIYVCGQTNSANDVASGGYQNIYGGNTDAFLAKFDAAGNRIWATYYGGPGYDVGNSIAVDGLGNIYIAGQTLSAVDISSGGFQNTLAGNRDAFLVKFDVSGNRIWGTYYGGTEYDVGNSVAVDVIGNVYLVGTTFSAAGIASGGFQNIHSGNGAYDAFLVKFDAAGNRSWGTYYGGTATDRGTSVVTDVVGNVYLAGITNSTSNIASAGFQNSLSGGNDLFLVRFNTAGNRSWATYYGGTGVEYQYDDAGISIDITGNVYLVGQTASTGNISSGGFQSVFGGGGNDLFLVKFDAVGSRQCATYYGDTGNETFGDVVVDDFGNVYLAGSTQSTTNIAAGGFQNLHAGSYDGFLVKFTSCCPTLSVSPGAAICNGTSTVLTASGASAYSWIPAVGLTTNTGASVIASPTATTSYTVTGTSGTCSNTSVVTVTVGQIPLSVVTSSVNCNGVNTGTANAVINGGSAGYSFLWNNTETTQGISNLAAGVYSVTVSNGSCIATASVNISQPQALVLNTSGVSSACAYHSGSANVTVTGGTGPFSYSWSAPGGTTNGIFNLYAGLYSVTVTDANGCSDITTHSVIANGSLNTSTAIPGNFTNLNCYGDINGVTGVVVVNGGATSAFTYLWNNGSTTSVISNLAAGVYTCTVSDGNGCTSVEGSNIIQPATFSATITVIPASCGQNNGAASVAVSGGTPFSGPSPYNYGWHGIVANGPVASNLSAGTYSITIVDRNGCRLPLAFSITNTGASFTNTITVSACNSYTLNGQNYNTTGVYTQTLVSSNGCDSILTLDLTISNTITTNGNVSVCSGQSAMIHGVNESAAGVYSQTFVAVGGCDSVSNITLILEELPVVSFTTDITQGCAPVCVNFSNTTPNTLLASWQFGDGNTQNGNSINYCYPHSGLYSVSLTVTGINNCSATVVPNNPITVHPNPVAAFSANPQQTSIIDPLVSFSESSQGATQWQWMFGDVNNAGSTEQNSLFTYTDTGVYRVQLIVANEFGCKDTAVVPVKIYPEYLLFTPNAITPNGDNNNDVFKPVGSGIIADGYELIIFDRWGNVIFKTSDPGLGWDGKISNGAVIQDTYIWRIYCRDFKNVPYIYTGHLNVIK